MESKSKKVLYHITPKKNLKSILKHGLVSDYNSVHLTDMPLLWINIIREYKELKEKDTAIVQIEIPIEEYCARLRYWAEIKEEYWSDMKEGCFVDFDTDDFTEGVNGEIIYVGKIIPEWITAYYILSELKVKYLYRNKQINKEA